MKRNVGFCGVVCLVICLLGAPGLAQASGIIGPELRQWIEDPAQGLAAMREGRIPDLPKAPEVKAKAAPMPTVPAPTEKSVAITFIDPGMEAAVRANLGKPTGTIYDTDAASITYLRAVRFGIEQLVDLQYLPNLSNLYMPFNKITTLADIPPNAKLSSLNVNGNRLTSFAGMPSLPGLGLLSASRNQITTLAGMPSFPLLSELTLESNQITSLAEMPEFPHLTKLLLAHNLLTEVTGLPDVARFEELDLSHNALQSLSGMPKYPTVDVLDISFNQLSSAEGLYSAGNVYQLHAGHNRLESLGVIGQLAGLHELTLESNRLTSLAGMAEFQGLSAMDISQNRLSSLTGVEHCPALASLNASGNCLRSLGALAGADKLLWLSLAACGLNSLADFPRMPQLLYLDVSCNLLASLAEMGDTPALQNLEARFNQLQVLDTGFRPMLTYLGLSSNGLVSLSTLNGANAPYLGTIDVSFNHLMSLQGIENVPSLGAITARANQINSLAALSQNPGVHLLDVSSNHLISFDDLPPNPPLDWLDASRNHIASLSGLAAAANLYLNRLDVAHNVLTSVAEIATASHLYRLDVSDNQITDISPLEDRRWSEMGIANNPTGDVQSVLFARGITPTVSVSSGQLPSLAPFGSRPAGYVSIHADGPEYSDLSLLGPNVPRELSVSNAAISSLDGLKATMDLYRSQIQKLALPNDALSDLSPLTNVGMSWLDVSGNSIADISPVTNDYLNAIPYTTPIWYLNASSNPLASLTPALDARRVQEHYPTIGALFFAEYEWEQFGMTPEQAHDCFTFSPKVDVTDTPVAAAPEVNQLREEGVRVITDGTCSYCQGACLPPQPLTVPDVVGQTASDAVAAVQTAGLVVGSVTQQNSDTVPAGSVMAQSPAAGTSVPAGTAVALVLSLGPNPAEGEIEGELPPPLNQQALALYAGFAAADTNGDGRLDLAEAQTAQPELTGGEFALLDCNGDGVLSKRELDAYLDGPGGGCHGCACRGGAAGLGSQLGELAVLFLGLLGLGIIGNITRP